MAALGLSLALFLYWLVVGYAVVSILHARRNALRNLLLAPPVGVASTVLPVFLLNRIGLPVVRLGWPLLLALLAVSGLLLWRTRAPLPVRRFAPFGAVLLAALWLVARPMIEFGFDWISYANDDMANYVLGAQFFLSNSFPHVPEVARLVDGSDYTLYYWFFYIPHAVRPGSELLLAWVVSLTGLTGHQAFMPLIVSLHLALISAAAGLVLRVRRDRFAALLTAALLAVSALTAFATLAQLLAQVAGLGMLATLAALLLRPLDRGTTAANIRAGALAGGLGAALLIVYPEVLPFLGLAFLCYAAIGLLRKTIRPLPLVRLLASAALAGLALINIYLLDVVLFMSIQLNGGLRAGDANGFIFPYFLVPSGLADFWGFQTIDRVAPEPFRSITIALGGALLLIVLVQSVRLAWRGHAGATLGLVMLAFAGMLFLRSIDFGLFKLALFTQPFVLGALAVVVYRSHRRWLRWEWVPVLLVAGAGALGQWTYVERSRGEFNEIPNGSQSRINTEFVQLLQSVHPRDAVLDTINISLAKFQALYTRGVDATFPSRDFFSYIIGRDLRNQVIVPGTFENARVARDAVDGRFLAAFFALHDPADPSATNEFRINTLGQTSTDPTSCDAFISGTATQSVFNRRHSNPTDTANFSVLPCRDVHNHLIFVHSKLGQHYYQVDQHYFGEDKSTIGIYGLEPDPLLIGKTMAGVGRHLLFEVIGPSPRVRLALDFTATLKVDGENLLPPAAALGTQRESFPLVGRGDARVFSAPLTPQVIDGRSYVALDMGVDGKRFTEDRTGLMGLYGTDIPYDRRELVAFARDISVVADDEYARLKPPTSIQSFPADLENPDLVYSGIYEDGWLSDTAYFELSQPDNANALFLRGMLPLVREAGFTSDVLVVVDGQLVAQQTLAPGEFRIDTPVTTRPGRHRVELHFSRIQRLLAPDTRPAASLLRSIGFGIAGQAPALGGSAVDIVAAGSGLSLVGTGWYAAETFAGDAFRWVNNDADVNVPASLDTTRRLRIDLEAGPGLAEQPFDLLVIDGEGRLLETVPVTGRQTISVAVPATVGDATVVRLHVEGGGQPAQNDPRTLNFRVFALGWDNGT